MQTNGKLIKVLPIETGEGQNGPWTRGGVVIETLDDYPKPIAFQLFGEDRVKSSCQIPLGTIVQVTFAPQSREYNGKWYTQLNASSVQPLQQMQSTSAPQQTAIDCDNPPY